MSITPFGGAYSIGKAQRSSPLNNNETPGPGQYSETVNERQPAYQFTKSTRKPLQLPNKNPDPAQYDTMPKTTAPAYKFPKAAPPEDKPHPIGPGAYHPREVGKGPSFTFQSRFDHVGAQSLKVPGPGEYDLIKSKEQVPKNVGFSTSTRVVQSSLQHNPGPGQYNTDAQSVAASVRFPKSQRSLETSQITPGPGAFDLLMPRKQGITFGVKAYQSVERHQVPGPGSYTSISAIDQKKGVTIGQSKRGNLNGKKIGPSPFEYDVGVVEARYKKEKIGTFSKGDRPSMMQKMITPGPGAYEVDSQLAEIGTIIPRAQRDSHNNKQYPGPGKYNPNDSAISNTAPKYHIGNRHEKQSEQSILGPGRYEISRELNNGPKYKFGLDERSKDNLSLDQNSSHCYDIQGTIGQVPNYLRNRIN